ncbi:uncharacterized protein PHALS_14158 [Plasmopara halstedii]|uniref:Uncharacterized protein n=1 Tax=Plasmopara halstedii TaxID=4781 RepID=A0A0P1ARR8_PLAHL|nr:uncharacterized protein PHALS_14158 [Plasmopara halstedii]CEG43871.1 hypothetical protein PHALS_14158 [Plasmopara halstedii]|eukprot:XP_024580240.1 hypothetical protein PHALS_14158 [Plasmopara halstedii]
MNEQEVECELGGQSVLAFRAHLVFLRRSTKARANTYELIGSEQRQCQEEMDRHKRFSLSFYVEGETLLQLRGIYFAAVTVKVLGIMVGKERNILQACSEQLGASLAHVKSQS